MLSKNFRIIPMPVVYTHSISSQIGEPMPIPSALFDIDGTLTSHNVWKGIMDFYSGRGERRLTHWVFVAAHYPLLLPRALRLLKEADFRRVWAEDLARDFRRPG